MSSLAEILVIEQQHYAARKAQIAEQRATLDMEERRMDMNMARLVEVVMQHSLESQIPEPRTPIIEQETTQ